MPLDNLRAFVDAIAAAGELARVERPVSVAKEVTEIADRCMKSPGGGPALLFRHPTLLHGGPSRFPMSSRHSTPSANAMRRADPNRFTAHGVGAGGGVSRRHRKADRD